MKRQPHHSPKIMVVLTSALSVPVFLALQIEPAFAASGQAGMGAQTAAQSSAASSSASNAAAAPATTPSPASSTPTPSSFAQGQAAPTPSLLPNSSSSNQSQPGQNAPSAPGTGAAVSSAPASTPASASAPLNSATPTGTIYSGGKGSTGNTAGGAKPSAASAGPQLRGLVNTPGTNSSSQTSGSVESFFQMPSSGIQRASQTRDGANSTNVSGSTSSEGSGAKSSHGALWHFMDNIGIPVPTANDYEALDPTLRRNYVDPKTPDINSPLGRVRGEHPLIRLRREATLPPPPAEAPRVVAPAPTAINVQKIPESELEGLDFSAKSDEQKQK